MSEKPTSLEVVSEEQPVMIGSIPLSELVQPCDYSGAATAGTPTRIQINKPKRDEWVTVRDGEEWQLMTWVLEETIDMDRTLYIVTPDLAQGELEKDAYFAALYLSVSSTGRLFWWHIKQPKNNKRNHWSESARKAAEKAMEGKWIRVIPAHEGYEIREAKARMPEPQWGDFTREEAIQLAFEDQIIDTMEHPVARRLTLGA